MFGVAAVDKVRLIARILALQARARWPRERILRHQARELAKLRRFALARSAFYRRFHKGLERAPLHTLPVLTKAQLIDAYNDVVTDPAINLQAVERFAQSMSVMDLFDGRYHICATSGTTGRRAYVPFNRDEWRWIMAGVPRVMAWSGFNARERGRGVVMSTTVPWHMTARAAADLRRLKMDAGRLSVDAGEPVDRVVERLNAYQPTAIVGYPSLLHILAGEQSAGRLAIAPRSLVCTSEVLTADARDAITHAFGVVPHNLYATTETGGLAGTCKTGAAMHVADDAYIVEIVDEKNAPVPPGETGAKALVTVLFGRTMPLIRYEISDRLTASHTPCGCGLPFLSLDAVGGRTGDVLRLKTRSGGEALIAPAQISAALRGLSVTGWQLTIDGDVWTIGCVVTTTEFPADAIRARIAALLEQNDVAPPRIEVERLTQLERGPSGKSTVIKTIAR
jgi:phenylacetate-CoA ligase